MLLMQQDNPWINKWNDNALLSWILVQPNTQLEALNGKLNKLLPARTGNASDGLFAYPLADLHLKGSFNRQGKPAAGRLEAILLLIITGLFVLLIACINFMNLATAQSEKRSREVGVRKVMGAFRRQVIVQFLVEALLVAFFAMLAGIILALIALPLLNGFAGSGIRFSINDWKIWAALLGLIVFTGLVAGSYPAFYLSSFKPVRILRGAIFKRKGGSWLRKGLVTFQFVLSIFLIVATIVIFKQLEYAQDRPVGYEQENLVEIPVRGDMGAKFDIIRNDLLGLPGIASVSSGSDNLVQFGSSTSDINWPGKPADQQFQFVLSNVNYDWVKTVGMKLAEGRDFSSTFGTDTTAVIINQSAVQKMGLKTPIVGTKVSNHIVIGVLEDFVFNSVYEAPRPMLIYLSKNNISHLFLRIRNNEQWRSTMKQVESILKSNNPNYPFEYHFTSEVYQKRFTGVKYMSQLVTGVGIMAIFISCLGLFGLAGFLAERRTKEIGVRKVLGAKVMQLWLMLSKDFLKPVVVAFLIAAPLSGWIMQQMLANWEYHTSLAWWIFAVAGLLALFIAVCTVSFHGIKAAFTNPAKSLRSE
jgi:ABC-type antimicrobial peptide transport system permease subunit